MTGTPAIATTPAATTRVHEDDAQSAVQPVQFSHLADQTPSRPEQPARHQDPAVLFQAPSSG